MRKVKFFFGPGSRYSYLAAHQMVALRSAEVQIDWLPLYSGELMQRIGNGYLVDPARAGQYTDAYRHTDVSRWAKLLGLPYVDAPAAGVDFPLMVRACLVAKKLARVEEFVTGMYQLSFGRGVFPSTHESLAQLAQSVGLDGPSFTRGLDLPETSAEQQSILEDAVALGVFGVPTFVVDGELFWGQDRLPLLKHYLEL